MTMDFEDYMVDVEIELDGLAEEQGEELSTEARENIMYHLFENAEDYILLTADVCAETLLNEYHLERLQLV